MNQRLYDSAIENSCLKDDILNFPKKDETIIGEKGITLSGGQKTRLALARALFIDSDILVLDDPFSAVDVKVGMSIYEKTIEKMRKDKVIILASHHIQYFKKCDNILILDGGTIKEQGTFLTL